MNVLITGASKGIGYALAKKFANEERIKLFLISRSEKNLLKLQKECLEINKQASICTIPFDLNRLFSEDLPKEINISHLDILVNNAGMLINKDFESLKIEEISGIVNTNFILPAILVQKLLPLLGGKLRSHVVNIGSMGGYQGSVKFPGLSIYSASKAALASLTECLAAEYADENIYFNCLALGAVQTEMLEDAFPGYKAPVSAIEMSKYIADFAINGYQYYNGKVIPVSLSTP